MSADGKLNVPNNPILPFIEGDGTGPDIWRASQRVLDAAVEKAYGGQRKIAWYEVYAGEKSFRQFKNWLPDETVEAYRTRNLLGVEVTSALVADAVLAFVTGLPATTGAHLPVDGGNDRVV